MVVFESDGPPNLLRLPMHPQSSGAARAFVRRQAEAAGFTPLLVDDITLAVGEAVANALEHGRRGSDNGEGGLVTIQVERELYSLVITIRDTGPGFDPSLLHHEKPVSLLAERGRGLALMEMLMDRVELFRLPDGMQVRLEKRLPSEEDATPGVDVNPADPV